MVEGRTYDSTEIRLGGSELGEDVLEHELLHAVFDLWVVHDERAERGCHVQSAESLSRRGISGTASVWVKMRGMRREMHTSAGRS